MRTLSIFTSDQDGVRHFKVPGEGENVGMRADTIPAVSWKRNSYNVEIQLPNGACRVYSMAAIRYLQESAE